MRYYLSIVILILFTGCTNISYNQLSSDLDVNVTANLNASITVGEKITGNGTETLLFWFFRLPGTKYRASGTTTSMSYNSPATLKIPILSSFNFLDPTRIIENAKGEAIYDAITASKADIIINPRFLITESDFFFYKTVKCEVTGLKGTIKKVQ